MVSRTAQTARQRTRAHGVHAAQWARRLPGPRCPAHPDWVLRSPRASWLLGAAAQWDQAVLQRREAVPKVPTGRVAPAATSDSGTTMAARKAGRTEGASRQGRRTTWARSRAGHLTPQTAQLARARRWGVQARRRGAQALSARREWMPLLSGALRSSFFAALAAAACVLPPRRLAAHQRVAALPPAFCALRGAVPHAFLPRGAVPPSSQPRDAAAPLGPIEPPRRAATTHVESAAPSPGVLGSAALGDDEPIEPRGRRAPGSFGAPFAPFYSPWATAPGYSFGLGTSLASPPSAHASSMASAALSCSLRSRSSSFCWRIWRLRSLRR